MNKFQEALANDVFLADWISGKIDDAALRKLVSPQDFDAYQKLRKACDSYEMPSTNTEHHFAEIQEKIRILQNVSKTKVFPLYRYAAAAAFLLVLFGLFQFFGYTNTIKTGIGKRTQFTLNDQSTIVLNANSKLEYPNLFQFHRSLKLEGEAFFKVAKGRTFCVNTPQGTVTVIGTQFNVIARPDFFEVICYEGSVSVDFQKQHFSLIPGNAIRIFSNETVSWTNNSIQKPTWLTGESSFRKVPFQFVISELQNQYQLQISYPSSVKSVAFTGSFTQKNLDVALQSICLPMQLKYTQTTTGEILITE